MSPASPPRGSPGSAANVRPDRPRVRARPLYAAGPGHRRAGPHVAAPPGATVQVGGQTAALADQLSSIGHTLPWMALAVVIATFVLCPGLRIPRPAPRGDRGQRPVALGDVRGGDLDLPGGHLLGPPGFTPDGTISPTIPVLMFAIMFGLSMDYEVFLLARIHERYVATGDNTGAIASGLQRTGGVITSAALLLVVVIGMSPCRASRSSSCGRRDLRRPRPRCHPGPAGSARDDAASGGRELVGARAAAPPLRPVRHPPGRRPRPGPGRGTRIRACLAPSDAPRRDPASHQNPGTEGTQR